MRHEPLLPLKVLKGTQPEVIRAILMPRERVAPQSEVIWAIVLEDSPCCVRGPHRLEVLGLEPVGVVDVAANLLALAVLVPDVHDRGQLAVAHQLLPLGQRLQQRIPAEVLVRAGKLLRLRVELGDPGLLGRLLLRLELRTLQDLAAAAIAQLDQVARQLLVLEVVQVLLRDLRV